ncbi:FadR/GntR family transcriptional regulator [Amycolatopsis vastitatis]|uniref:GntR family transcriptional regulator n=1 Tax=Amycolatopsis vastitatis TaxID=1905142 RepID=A0A229SMG5_9PSEU|nr:FadR/GntR family transcriptional regulator [Amycolatopsis vastitatis]OXM59984.1 GntR family transcriptional regulator [Amycolatopsis vastitatis]
MPTDGGAYRPGYEVAAERILELIDGLSLRAGDRLPTEIDLAQQLDTSRSVVREAIKVLSALGRVTAQKGRGLYVADGTSMLGGARQPTFFLPTKLEHVDRLFEFRKLIDVEASRLAATRATPLQLNDMREAAADCISAFEAGDFEAFGRADDRFHESVAAAAQNPFLSEAVIQCRRAQRQTARLGLPTYFAGNYSLANQEHTAILAAIQAGDVDRADQAARNHIDRTEADYRQDIMARLSQSGQGTRTPG